MKNKLISGNEKKTTSEKPVSLAPLDFKEALSALLKIKPKPKDRERRRQEKRKAWRVDWAFYIV